MGPVVKDTRALEALRESWPGAFRVQGSALDLRRDAMMAADRLAAGDRQVIDRLFGVMECDPPALQWSPEEADLDSEILVFLRRYGRERMRGDDLPLSREIDALDLVPALGYVMLMEPVKGGVDFRYRVYGSRIVDYSKVEMTGKCVWDVPSPWVATYFAATYRAVCIRREPLYTFHRSRLDQLFAQWERLILPFVDDNGTVDRLLVGNVPSLRR